MKKRITFITIFIVMAMLLTGCTKGIDITTEQNDIVAEYIAGVLIKNSYYYMDKYEDLKETYAYEEKSEPETETETITPETEPETPVINPTDDTDTPASETETNSDGKWHVAEAIGLSPLEIEYVSYDITNEYPKDEGSLFSFTAEDGYTFIVLNFKLYNNTEGAVTVNNSQLKPAIKLYINDYAPTYNYGNLMFNDITNLKELTINSKSSYDGIIVFMVDEEFTKDIKTMTVQYNGIEQVIN